jgi:hypothetical protein
LPSQICRFWYQPFLVLAISGISHFWYQLFLGHSWVFCQSSRPVNHNILAFEQQIIARYGRQTLSKADIVAQRRIPLATAFKPDE